MPAIPVRLNLALVAAVVALALGLLTLASRAEDLALRLALGVAFSYVMLTGYALLHEAAHDNLHPDPRWNRRLGRVVGALFPAPYAMVRRTHRGHHERNRTDAEMFDLYYPGGGGLAKRVQWYGILCGFFWPLVPLGALVHAFLPRALTPFRARADSRPLLDDLSGEARAEIRRETVGIAFAWVALALFLDLSLAGWATCYACFAFSWSTRQYVGHAFTRRDVVEGAWNLRHNRVMSFVLLHGEWDLNHHRHPEAPWIALPRFPTRPEERRGYARQYWAQWRGPRETREPAPASPGAAS